MAPLAHEQDVPRRVEGDDGYGAGMPGHVAPHPAAVRALDGVDAELEGAAAVDDLGCDEGLGERVGRVRHGRIIATGAAPERPVG